MQNVSKYAPYVKLVSPILVGTMKYQTQSLVAHVQLDHMVLGNEAIRIS